VVTKITRIQVSEKSGAFDVNSPKSSTQSILKENYRGWGGCLGRRERRGGATRGNETNNQKETT